MKLFMIPKPGKSKRFMKIHEKEGFDCFLPLCATLTDSLFFNHELEKRTEKHYFIDLLHCLNQTFFVTAFACHLLIF